MRYNLSKNKCLHLPISIALLKQKLPKLRSSLSQSVICTLTQPYLVTEDFNLAVGTVHRFVTPVVVAVGVNLKIQGQAFNSLLRRKVCAEAVHRDENLQKRKTVLISSVTLIARCLDWPCFIRSPSTFPGHLTGPFSRHNAHYWCISHEAAGAVVGMLSHQLIGFFFCYQSEAPA